MGAKRVFCTIFYVIFTLIFTGLLVCNVTAFLSQFSIMPNNFFTTSINTNLLTPFHSAFNTLHIMDSLLLWQILCIAALGITLFFWFLSVSILVNVLRNTPTKGPGVSSIVFGTILFLVSDAVVLILASNGISVTELLQNYYLMFIVALWFFVVIFAIIALTIKAGFDELSDSLPSAENEISPALAREKRIQELLNEGVDPRI